MNIQAVNGCCYGTDNREYGDYRKVCGKAFWELISGDDLLFHNLMLEINKVSANGYQQDILKVVNKIADELKDRWSINGRLDWNSIIRINSSGEAIS